MVSIIGMAKSCLRLPWTFDKAPNLFNSLKCNISTKLQCSKCFWVSSTVSSDVLFKLYLTPGHKKSISFADLLDFNSRASLQSANAVWCGHCNVKTKQTSVRETTSDIVLFEVIRVTQKSNTWSKNTIPITFPIQDVMLFGRKYHVVGTCHHKGSLQFGHWFTKLCLNDGTWYTLDDLNTKHRRNSCYLSIYCNG